MAGIRHLSPYRIIITRVVLLYYLLFLLWRGYSHLLPFQLESPVLTEVNYDPVFILLKVSGFSGFIVGNKAAGCIFSMMVILLCVFALFFPRKRLFVTLFTLFYFLFAVIFNTYLCHASHYLAAMVLVSVAFWPQKDENFDLLWEGVRYFSCWVYGSAFLWKILLGSFFQWEGGLLSFRENMAAYLYQNPDTDTSHLYYYYYNHPLLLNIGHKLVILAEGAFLVGFFTKRYDKLLIVLALIIFSGIYAFADVFFIELQVIIFTFLPVGFWKWLSVRAPLFNR